MYTMLMDLFLIFNYLSQREKNSMYRVRENYNFQIEIFALLSRKSKMKALSKRLLSPRDIGNV